MRTEITAKCFEPFQKLRAMLSPLNRFKPTSKVLLTVPGQYFCCGSLMIVFGVGFGDVSPCVCIDCFSFV